MKLSATKHSVAAERASWWPISRNCSVLHATENRIKAVFSPDIIFALKSWAELWMWRWLSLNLYKYFHFLKLISKLQLWNDVMLTSYKHHDVSLGHYLKLTEICTEFNRLRIRAKMFKHLNENEEQYFSDSCVSARNPDRVQTASKCLIKPSLPLQVTQTPQASVTVFAWTKTLGMTAQLRVSGTKLQGDFWVTYYSVFQNYKSEIQLQL